MNNAAKTLHSFISLSLILVSIISLRLLSMEEQEGPNNNSPIASAALMGGVGVFSGIMLGDFDLLVLGTCTLIDAFNDEQSNQTQYSTEITDIDRSLALHRTVLPYPLVEPNWSKKDQKKCNTVINDAVTKYNTYISDREKKHFEDNEKQKSLWKKSWQYLISQSPQAPQNLILQIDDNNQAVNQLVWQAFPALAYHKECNSTVPAPPPIDYYFKATKNLTSLMQSSDTWHDNALSISPPTDKNGDARIYKMSTALHHLGFSFQEPSHSSIQKNWCTSCGFSENSQKTSCSSHNKWLGSAVMPQSNIFMMTRGSTKKAGRKHFNEESMAYFCGERYEGSIIADGHTEKGKKTTSEYVCQYLKEYFENKIKNLDNDTLKKLVSDLNTHVNNN